MSETVTMTLTDFLLARITEDEAVARNTKYGPRHLIPAGPFGLAMFDPDRVLAECAAKRAIVEFFHDREVSVALSNDASAEVYAAQSLERVVQMLALPYAAHPDYRDEWKP